MQLLRSDAIDQIYKKLSKKNVYQKDTYLVRPKGQLLERQAPTFL